MGSLAAIFGTDNTQAVKDAVAQNVLDQNTAAQQVALCERIKLFTSARASAFSQAANYIGAQHVPTDVNHETALEGQALVELADNTLAANYEGDVKGWAGGIQVMRSIASRMKPDNPNYQSVQDRLVFPVIPPALVTYAKTNGLG